MNTKIVLWSLLIVLAITGARSYYLQLNPHIKFEKGLLDTSIDTQISTLTVKQFNLEGQLINHLRTPLLEHVATKNVHLLHHPYIVIHQENQPAWEIQSHLARSVDGGKKITFLKEVVVHQQGSNATQESTLKTEKIIYYPKEKKATTNLFVTFEQPGHTIESTGMNAYLDEKRVELLHQAKGSYVPINKG